MDRLCVWLAICSFVVFACCSVKRLLMSLIDVIEGGAAAAAKALTKEEKIALLEEELAKMNAKTMTTTANQYGLQRQEVLETFPVSAYNIKKNEDLMPCPRRPPGKK